MGVVAVKNTAGCGALDRRTVGISRDLQHLEPVAQRNLHKSPTMTAGALLVASLRRHR